MREPAETSKRCQQTLSCARALLPKLREGLRKIVLLLRRQRHIAVSNAPQRVCKNHAASDKQQQLIEEDVAVLMNQGMSYEEAYEETLRETMPAGYSEHQTGLAVDIASAKDAELSTRQIETEENKWLQENCYKYGFIVRYPEGKSDITHIDYEPWHFRYVGKAVARYMMEHNLTLEEFLEEIEE